ncbi:MAG: DUF4038 domain-containing protein [Planctomycetota bacterium]
MDRSGRRRPRPPAVDPRLRRQPTPRRHPQHGQLLARTPLNPTQIHDRRLLRADGTPFVWLGDTAWELAHRLTLDQIRHYAETRAAQGFTLVQFCVLAELDGLRTPNRNGDLPLLDLDPTRPNPRYLEFVADCCDVLIERGLVPCVLPTWGDKVHRLWGVGPEVLDADNAGEFGRRVAETLAGRPLVWMLGGDRPCPEIRHRETWHALADGLGDTGLKTFHPPGGTGTHQHIGTPPWLDFACIQSGHTVHTPPADTRAAELLQRELAAHDLPVIDAEPLYEAHPKFRPDWKSDYGRSSAEEVLDIMQAQLDAGAAGVTYGCHAVWQMHDPARNTTPINRPIAPWHKSLQLPAALAAGQRFGRPQPSHQKSPTAQPNDQVTNPFGDQG